MSFQMPISMIDNVPIIKELIERDSFEAPTLKINPSIQNFYDFTVDDFELSHYQKGEQIRNIPVAI
jgi:thymidylate synthase